MKKRNYIIIGIVVIGIITIGISYAYWTVTHEQKGVNEITSSCFEFEFSEKNDITMEDAIPILNSEGEKLTPYEITIKNKCNIDSNYVVNLEVMDTLERLPSKYIEVKVNSEDEKILTTYPTSKGIIDNVESYKIGEGRLTKDQVITYEVRIWIDEEVKVENKDAMNKTFKSKVTVEGVTTTKEDKYTESILNGADPVLADKLIPVVIDENGGVKRADEQKKWYNYANQEWANAVILNDKEANPEVGAKIDESEIESYFVWIPRYRYKIFNDGNYTGLSTKEDREQTIQVIFETKDKEAQSGSTVGTWLTHPAFTAFNTNGIWVGKFETGYEGAENTGQAQVNPSNEAAAIEAADKVIIKPNVYSWRNIQVSRAYVVGRHYNETLQSHMMKNTEWGAVAYLQHSMYGSRQKVRINNNQSYLTGYAGKNEPTIGLTNTNESCTANKDACNEYCTSDKGVNGTCNTQYFDKASVIASTTNNYTGIFDMSGGAWEYMMSGMDDGTGKLSSGRHNVWNSGFNGKLTCPECTDAGVNHEIKEVTGEIELPTEEKWYDKYTYGTSNVEYKKSILGDATKEMGPFQSVQYKGATGSPVSRNINSWYDNTSWVVLRTVPWVVRGGMFVEGSDTGVFSFAHDYGHASSRLSFRLVLAI